MSRIETPSTPITWCDTPSLRNWIEATDEHSASRLPLFEAAIELLLGTGHSSPNWELSAACERWRYQLLKHSRGRLSVPESALVNLLDVASNKAAGRAARAPRRARQSVGGAGGRPRDCSLNVVEGRTIHEWLTADSAVDDLTRRAAELTVSPDDPVEGCPSTQRTGCRHVSLFAPIYLSNYCVNHCPYCWFRFAQKIVRRHLTVDQVRREALVLAEQGVRDVLLVAGDYPKVINVPYLTAVGEALRDLGFTVAIEIAPQSTTVYAALVDAGIDGVTLYQETYNRARYYEYHSWGRKADYDWRLEALDRAAEAGMKRLGLGVLLGLADPVEDVASLVDHGNYLSDRFPEAQLAFSLPRLHSTPPPFHPRHPVDDELLVKLYCFLRLAFPSAHLVSSTREPAELRNRLAQICVSRMSAGSKTSPGGYNEPQSGNPAGGQFPISDARSIDTVRSWLSQQGWAVS